VIVERPFHALLPADQPFCRLLATADNGVWDTWWIFSPAFIVQSCEIMGFTDVRVTSHVQQHYSGPIEMFTVVASRAGR